jgi:hypothetical protein
VWFQLNAQFIWDWAKKNPLLLTILGLPFTYLFILATNFDEIGVFIEKYPMNDKLRHFVELYLQELLVKRFGNDILDIKLTKFDHNDYNNKYYPNFIVYYTGKYLTISEQDAIKKTILSEINSFFPEVFVVLQANIKFDKLRTNIDE